MPHITKDVFSAIADPTRRQIITMLAKEPLNVNAIAQQFDITRQAVSLHVQFLHECGLVSITQHGRERSCSANLDALDEVSDWVAESKKVWTHRFKSLEKFLENTHRSKSSPHKNEKHAKHKHQRKRG